MLCLSFVYLYLSSQATEFSGIEGLPWTKAVIEVLILRYLLKYRKKIAFLCLVFLRKALKNLTYCWAPLDEV